MSARLISGRCATFLAARGIGVQLLPRTGGAVVRLTGAIAPRFSVGRGSDMAARVLNPRPSGRVACPRAPHCVSNWWRPGGRSRIRRTTISTIINASYRHRRPKEEQERPVRCRAPMTGRMPSCPSWRFLGRPLHDLHHGVLGEAKVAADKAVGQAITVHGEHLLRLVV